MAASVLASQSQQPRSSSDVSTEGELASVSSGVDQETGKSLVPMEDASPDLKSSAEKEEKTVSAEQEHNEEEKREDVEQSPGAETKEGAEGPEGREGEGKSSKDEERPASSTEKQESDEGPPGEREEQPTANSGEQGVDPQGRADSPSSANSADKKMESEKREGDGVLDQEGEKNKTGSATRDGTLARVDVAEEKEAREKKEDQSSQVSSEQQAETKVETGGLEAPAKETEKTEEQTDSREQKETGGSSGEGHREDEEVGGAQDASRDVSGKEILKNTQLLLEVPPGENNERKVTRPTAEDEELRARSGSKCKGLDMKIEGEFVSPAPSSPDASREVSESASGDAPSSSANAFASAPAGPEQDPHHRGQTPVGAAEKAEDYSKEDRGIPVDRGNTSLPGDSREGSSSSRSLSRGVSSPNARRGEASEGGEGAGGPGQAAKEKRLRKKKKKTVFESIPAPSKADTGANAPALVRKESQTIFISEGSPQSKAHFRACDKIPERQQTQTVFQSQRSEKSLAHVRYTDKLPDRREGPTVFEAQRSEKSTAHFRAGEKLADRKDGKSVYESLPKESSAAVRYGGITRQLLQTGRRGPCGSPRVVGVSRACIPTHRRIYIPPFASVH